MSVVDYGYSLGDLIDIYGKLHDVARFARGQSLPEATLGIVDEASTRIAAELDRLIAPALRAQLDKASERDRPLHLTFGDRLFRVVEGDDGPSLVQVSTTDARRVGLVHPKADPVPVPA